MYEKQKLMKCKKCGSDEVIFIRNHIQWILNRKKFTGKEFICCECGHIHGGDK